MSTLRIPQHVQSILQTFKKEGFEIYVVGGCIRDLIQGRETRDWDFTTNAIPDQIRQLYPHSFYDNRFGTVGVPIHSKENDSEPIVYEITTYRSEEGYSDNRHPDRIMWGKTLQEDLARRDFTINALAYDGDRIIDLYTGLEDLKTKCIRAVGNPDLRFKEDALRMMRAIRIATQLQFIIEPKTFDAIASDATLIKKISSERIRDELLKIVSSDYAVDGIKLLRSSGILPIILPELEESFGVPQKSPKRHHVHDVGTHLLMSLQNCPSKDPITRLATLLHDIGKPKTFKKMPDGVITFYNHEIVGASMVYHIAQRLRMSKKQREKLVKLARYHQFTVDHTQTDSAVRRFIRHVGLEYLPDMLALRTGDRLGGGARETSWRLELFKKRIDEVQKQPFTVSDLKVNGHDVMKLFSISPGPKVGEILNVLFAEVEAGKLPNEREALLKKLEELKTVKK